jgi:hypothetical protein
MLVEKEGWVPYEVPDDTVYFKSQTVEETLDTIAWCKQADRHIAYAWNNQAMTFDEGKQLHDYIVDAKNHKELWRRLEAFKREHPALVVEQGLNNWSVVGGKRHDMAKCKMYSSGPNWVIYNKVARVLAWTFHKSGRYEGLADRRSRFGDGIDRFRGYADPNDGRL